jgi:hypothetical protein
MPAKRTTQSVITSMVFPVLQKPTDICVDRQMNVPGSYWIVNQDHMSDEEVSGSNDDRIFFMKYPCLS